PKTWRAQRLAWGAIGLAGVSTTCAIGFGVAFLARQPSRENWPADMGTPSLTPALVMDRPTPAPEPTQQPSPTPDVTLAPLFAIEAPTSTPTAKATATARSRIKHLSRRQS